MIVEETNVEVCRNFICATRKSNWTFHLCSAVKMMSLLAATGQHNYAKPTCVYVQFLFDLPEKHPWLHQKFADEDLFVSQRSDCFWVGLQPDLTIEQYLMLAIKSTGDLTRESGFTESVQILWIHIMHASAIYHTEVSSLTQNCSTF